MPVFTITVSAAEGTRVMNALCALEDLPPTQANALALLRKYIVTVVKDYEFNQAYLAVAEPPPVVPT
jgi:hypothetical protein